MEKNTEQLKFLIANETAELLQVPRRTQHFMIHRNDLPAFKVGGQWRIREDALAKWLEDFQERGGSATLKAAAVRNLALILFKPGSKIVFADGTFLDHRQCQASLHESADHFK